MSAKFNDTFIIISSMLAFIVPLVVNGPVAAKIYIHVLKYRDHSKLQMFWSFLVISNIIGGFFISLTGGHSGPGPGTCAYVTLPISSIVTVGIMRQSKEALFQAIENDGRWRDIYSSGKVIIPVLPYFAPIFSGIFILVPLCGLLFSRGFPC
jgi:hypothetical protein